MCEGTSLLEMSSNAGHWYKSASTIRGFLLDIYGVCYDAVGSNKVAIDGSVQAVKLLKDAGVPLRFCSNTSTQTKHHLVKELQTLGFDVTADDVFAPAPASVQMIQERKLRPHLLVHPDVLPEFKDVDQSNPNCVVIGDAQEHFTYENLNKAFRILLESHNPVLFSLGAGKYYKENNALQLDVGVYAKALEFATDVTPTVIGKPDKSFFMAALNDMGIEPGNAAMIGDDIVSDVGGAQACGIKGLQVRTGKYRPEDEPHSVVTPDGYVDNLKQAVDMYLQNR